jgi:hypothetical protein
VIENDLFGMTVVVTMLRKRPTEGSMSSGLMTSSSSLKVIFTFRRFFGKVSSLDIPIMDIRLKTKRSKCRGAFIYDILRAELTKTWLKYAATLNEVALLTCKHSQTSVT